MRPSTLQAAHFLLSIGAVNSLPEVAITKHRHADFNPARLQRRQNSDSGGTVETNTYDVLTWSTGGAYYANVTVGTPPQDQVVILDTGSSDLYFDSSTAASCQGNGPNSCRGGTFDHGASSSYKIVAQSPAFDTAFGDGSTAEGPFAEDTVGIGDVSIQGVQFGVADEVNSTTGYAVGLMGLGYSLNEASKRQYPNIPEVLATSGEIASRLYSIWLNDVDATSGTILFGGLDTSKFTGPLVTLNCLPTELQSENSQETADLVLQFITTATALNATVDGTTTTVYSGGEDSISAYSSSNAALPVLLDTGSSAWSIPQREFSTIASLFPYVDFKNGGLCECKHRDSDDSISVEFGGRVTISVPARQFIVPVYDPQTNQPQYAHNKEQICAFMLVPAQDESMQFQTLGDAVLRSMYVVFDLDNGQVSIAQASLDASAQPDIRPISAGLDGVAKAAGVSSSAASAPSNSYSVAAAVSGGETFTASTAASSVGTATGTDAVPANARASGTGAGSGGGGGGAASSSAAAVANARRPGIGIGADLAALGGIWVGLCMGFGGWMVLLA